jgi:hypothetical protein
MRSSAKEKNVVLRNLAMIHRVTTRTADSTTALSFGWRTRAGSTAAS